MASLDPLRQTLQRKAMTAARTTASDLESRLRRSSPVDTGNMRAKTTAVPRPTPTGAQITLKVDTDYAHIVAHGQRPHVITARPGGVLVFESGGRTVFARSVNHPGAQPRTWWADTLREMPDILARNFRNTR